MPQVIKTTVDGKEVEQEVYSKEELEAQATQRAEEAAQRAREETAAETQEKLDELNAELEKEKNKEKNFKALRDSKAGAVPEEITKQIESLTKQIQEIGQQPIKSVVAGFKKSNYGEDKDLNQKFDYYFERLGKDAKTEDEVLKAAQEAHALVGNGQKPNLDYRMTGSRISSDFMKPQQQVEESQAAKEISSGLGTTDEKSKKRLAELRAQRNK